MGRREVGDELAAERPGVGSESERGPSQRARSQGCGEAADLARGRPAGARAEQLSACGAETDLSARALEQDQAEFFLQATDALGDSPAPIPRRSAARAKWSSSATVTKVEVS